MSRPTAPRWPNFLAVLVGLAGVALGLAWGTSYPPPSAIVVDGPPTFQCGTTPRGDYGRHPWVIRNVGVDPVKLRTRFTSGSSGFSLWQGQDHVIPPGGRIVVSLTWPTPQLESVPYSHQVVIRTDDPDKPEIRLHAVGITGPPPSPRTP